MSRSKQSRAPLLIAAKNLAESLAATRKGARKRRALPKRFTAWIDFSAVPRESLLSYALLCRELLLAATGARQIEKLPWKYPEHRLPLGWLDQIAQSNPDKEMQRAVNEWFTENLTSQLSDPLRPVYEALVPPTVRQRLGEFYTPEWLADHVVGELWKPLASWLDPSVGSGGFALALRRRAGKEEDRIKNFAGIDRNPWAVLAAAANCALASAWQAGKPVCDFEIPIACFDLVTTPAPPALRKKFDRVLGNPPWVLWDRLSADYQARTKPIWKHYGLFAEKGMSSILGGGKKDLAMLITYVSSDKYLRPGGELGFVLTQSVFKSAGSARGFRRWQLPDGSPLGVRKVEDLSARQPFESASTKTSILFLRKGVRTRYPVAYHVWGSKAGEQPIEHSAQPASRDDPLSAWQHYEERMAPLLEAVLGPCDYRAHLGVNTGGANGVYWMQRLAVLAGGLWQMRNLTERGKRKVEPYEPILEPEYLYPLLIGKDVRTWIAEPSAWMLMVQDPKRRRGIDPEELKRSATRTFGYLARFETILRERAAFRRYFQRPGKEGAIDVAPFYSMFDVGAYTMTPVKVVWNRMGSRLSAAVVTQQEGKPILPQETHCLFALEREDEAHYLAALLNSRWVRMVLESSAQLGGKSFATPSTIHRLRLQRFDPTDRVHSQLALLGHKAQQETDSSGPGSARIDELDRLTARYWGLKRVGLERAGCEKSESLDNQSSSQFEQQRKGTTDEARL